MTIRALVLALVLVASGSVGAGAMEPPAALAAPATAPTCSIGDVITPLAGYGQVASTILDTRLRLPRSYAPTDLVSSSAAGINGGFRLRRIVITDLRAMAAAAARAHVRLGIDSGYRSWANQASVYADAVRRLGRAAADLRAARPGHSEHELGTTVDLVDSAGAYAWVKANGWHYGWVLSYDRGTTAKSCYQFEPWHFRWFGRARAAAIHASALVPRIYLFSRR